MAKPLSQRTKEWIGAVAGILLLAGLMAGLWYYEVRMSAGAVTLGQVQVVRSELAQYFWLHSAYPTALQFKQEFGGQLCAQDDQCSALLSRRQLIDLWVSYQPLDKSGAGCEGKAGCDDYQIPFQLTGQVAGLAPGQYVADAHGVHRTQP